MLPHLLKPSPHKLFRSLLPLSLLHSQPLSLSSSPSSAYPSFPSFLPLAEPSLSVDSSEVAASFKEWFKKGSDPVYPLDRIYAALSSSPDSPSLDAALSLIRFRLSEELVLRILHHSPHPTAVPPSNNLLFLRLKFFDWSGRQRGYRHTRSAFHAVFQLLSRARLVSIVFDWLNLFSTTRHHIHHHRPFLSPTAADSSGLPGGHPRFHDTLVVGYAVAGRPELALQLFARMRFQGLDLDSFSYHVLLNSLVEASIFDFADSIFTQIDARGLASPVTACIKMKSLCRQNKLDEAMAFLRDLHSSDGGDQRAVADHTVATLVHALCKKGRFEEAERLVDEFGTTKAYGVWIIDLVNAGKLDAAMDFLQSKKVSEDYRLENLHYNKLIFRLLKENRLEEVYDVLVEMMELGISPNRGTMNAALCFLCKAGMVDVAIQLYHSRTELGISVSRWVYSHLISALCRDGSVDEVCQILEESMQQGYFPGKQTFNIVANTLCLGGKLDKFEELLNDALRREVRPNTGVLARYISALCKAGKVEEACLVPQKVGSEGNGLGRYKDTYTSLIWAFVALRKVDVLPMLIIQMQEHGHSPSRSLYQAVVCCLCQEKRFGEVLDLLDKQLELKTSDQRTFYNYFIDGAAHSEKPEIAREVYTRMENAGVKPNMDSNLLLLQSYLKSKRISDALSFFYYLRDQKEPSTKLYNLLISGLCEARNPEQAVVFWREVREKGLIPSLQCYEELILALCSSRDYDIAVKVLEDFKDTGRQVSSFICNVLLLHTLKGQDLLRAWVRSRDWNIEVKPGEITDETPGSARMLLGQLIAAFSGGIRMRDNLHNLEEVVERYFPVDIYTYNMLLRGLIKAGRMDYACNLFNKIQKKGYEPNRWTFDIIVHGFCKHGMRKDAERWMKEMYRYKYQPTSYTMNLYKNTA